MALDANTTASSNTAVGYAALGDLTTASECTAVGDRAGQNVTTGVKGTFIGYNAGGNITDASHNIAIGRHALVTNASGAYNTAVGTDSLNTATGTQNTAVGADAGAALSTGNYNTFLGMSAGSSQTTGHDNVYIGRSCPENDGTNGEVMIYNGTNTARFQGSGTSWSITSDGRDKTDYQDLGLGIEFLKKIKPRQFKWDWRDGSKEGNGTIRAGFIAQEVLEACDSEGLPRTAADSIASNKVYPGVVDITNPDKYQVAAGDFVPMLVKAVQELSAQNEALVARITALESN